MTTKQRRILAALTFIIPVAAGFYLAWWITLAVIVMLLLAAVFVWAGEVVSEWVRERWGV